MAKPRNYQTVVPYLHLADAKVFVDFVTEVFGARDVQLTHDDKGRMIHGELWIGDAVLEFSESSGSVHECALHIFVDDPDATYAKALKHGATSLYEVTDHPYGERSGGVKGPDGNAWYIAHVTDSEKREM